MQDGLDLAAYLDRIQWGGSTRPTYETLAGVLRAHPAVLILRGQRGTFTFFPASKLAAR
jgi:hypothetical protein